MVLSYLPFLHSYFLLDMSGFHPNCITEATLFKVASDTNTTHTPGFIPSFFLLLLSLFCSYLLSPKSLKVGKPQSSVLGSLLSNSLFHIIQSQDLKHLHIPQVYIYNLNLPLNSKSIYPTAYLIT